MVICEEDVIIIYRLYLLSEEGKLAKQKYWIHNVFSQRRGRISYCLDFGKITGKNCSNILNCVFKNLNKELLLIQSQKKNTHL